jgi:hypothetical protein
MKVVANQFAATFFCSQAPYIKFYTVWPGNYFAGTFAPPVKNGYGY